MTPTLFKIGKKEFVIIPRKRYEQLTRAEQDRLDAEVARKGMEAYLSGKIKAIPLEVARRKWGV
jgi:PHD/YefM family antitoxin component YafN of YafNO toxin-antitoxin module